MSPASDRRGFLRGLAALPLIGGSVAIVGSPTAAAVPTSDALLRRYVAFTAREHQSAAMELLIRQAKSEEEMRSILESKTPIRWAPRDPFVDGMVFDGEPSSRAAVVLSAAGVPLA